jgi:NMD protein affecting ribosome stability and mRNA decay
MPLYVETNRFKCPKCGNQENNSFTSEIRHTLIVDEMTQELKSIDKKEVTVCTKCWEVIYKKIVKQ